MCGAAGEGLTRTPGTVVPRAGLRLVAPASPTRAQGSPGRCLLPSFSCAHSGSSLVTAECLVPADTGGLGGAPGSGLAQLLLRRESGWKISL